MFIWVDKLGSTATPAAVMPEAAPLVSRAATREELEELEGTLGLGNVAVPAVARVCFC